MSILWHVPKSFVKTEAKTHAESESVSIVLAAIALFLGIILVTSMVYTFTESSMKISTTCRDKIAGFEQRGMNTSSEQFKLVISYCGTS
jgi:hypothetical protein